MLSVWVWLSRETPPAVTSPLTVTVPSITNLAALMVMVHDARAAQQHEREQQRQQAAKGSGLQKFHHLFHATSILYLRRVLHPDLPHFIRAAAHV